MVFLASSDVAQMTVARMLLLLTLMWACAPMVKPSTKSNLFDYVSQCPQWVRVIVFLGVLTIYLADVLVRRQVS